MEKNYWAIHMGRNNAYADLAYEDGFIAIGWNEIGKDLSEYQKLDKGKFFEKMGPLMEKVYPTHSKGSRGQSIGQIFRFVNLIKVGDIVLMPQTKEGKVFAGTIESDYFYDESVKDKCPYFHRRSVKWVKIIDWSDVSQKLKYTLGSIMTLFSVNHYEQEIDSLLSDKLQFEDGTIENYEDFGLESHLKEFIIENWEKMELGKRYSILNEEKILIGQQYVTPVGRIDILAKNKNGKGWLVIELKKGKNSDQVVGQILRYMTWVKENEASDGEVVRGLIITREHDEKLKYSVRATTDVDLMTYSVNFNLKKVNSTQH